MKKIIIEPRHQAMSVEVIKNYKSQRDISGILGLILNKECTKPDNAEELTGGRCNLVYKIEDNDVNKIIKISSGMYRNTELKRESQIMKYLFDEGYKHLVPYIFDSNSLGDSKYLVEEYIEGKTVKDKLNNNKDKQERLIIWEKVGQTLSDIHKFYQDNDKTHSWLNGQLELARKNMVNNLLDPEEFEEETAIVVLDWLTKNKPRREKVSLLHGDYRTKNIIEDENDNYKVIDWGFVDIGDPYYDLSIIDYYFEDDLARVSFYSGYKDNGYSKDLIEYYSKLSKFINV